MVEHFLNISTSLLAFSEREEIVLVATTSTVVEWNTSALSWIVSETIVHSSARTFLGWHCANLCFKSSKLNSLLYTNNGPANAFRIEKCNYLEPHFGWMYTLPVACTLVAGTIVYCSYILDASIHRPIAIESELLHRDRTIYCKVTNHSKALLDKLDPVLRYHVRNIPVACIYSSQLNTRN